METSNASGWKWKAHWLRMARAARLVAVLAFAGAWGYGAAQQQREALRVTVQFTPQGDGAHTNVAVRLYNVSSHIVNVWMPGAVWCRPSPGAVWLEWRYRPVDHLGREQVRVDGMCGEATPGADGSELVARIEKQKRVWMTLQPGQYGELSDAINTSGVIAQPGDYTVRAVYTSPAFSGDDKRQLRQAGIDTPKGEYRSAPIDFAIR
jgi:hypothetical protein